MSSLAQSRRSTKRLRLLSPEVRLALREEALTVCSALGIVFVLAMFAVAYVIMP